MAFERDRYSGLAGFRSALRHFLAQSEAISQAGGVTAQQYQSLLAIGCGPPQMTMKLLAEQLLLRSHAAVQLVNRLEKAGLVTRTPSPADGRSVQLALSPAGEALLEDLAQKHLRELLRQEPLISDSLRRLKKAGA